MGEFRPFEPSEILDEILHGPFLHFMKTNDVWCMIFEKLEKLVKLDIKAHIVGTQSDLFFEALVTVKDKLPEARVTVRDKLPSALETEARIVQVARHGSH